jgi:hypothetical protein
MQSFWIPPKPMDAKTMAIRAAIACGSVSGAMAAEASGKMHHHLSLGWNDYRKYYVAEYYWVERVVITRDPNFASALKTTLEHFNRMDPHSTLTIHPKEGDVSIAAACEQLQPYTRDIQDAHFHSWFDQIEDEYRAEKYRITGKY